MEGISSMPNKRIITNQGYALVRKPGHPRAHQSYVLEHILIAEKVLGYPLGKAVVHHIDGNGTNNNKANLVICEDNTFHKLLHQRALAYKVSGNSTYRKCPYCKQYSDPRDMNTLAKNQKAHPECINTFRRESYQRRKIQVNSRRRKLYNQKKGNL